jgi:hypothetical protein
MLTSEPFAPTRQLATATGQSRSDLLAYESVSFESARYFLGSYASWFFHIRRTVAAILRASVNCDFSES